MENTQRKVHQTVLVTTTTRTDANGNDVVECLYGIPTEPASQRKIAYAIRNGLRPRKKQ